MNTTTKRKRTGRPTEQKPKRATEERKAGARLMLAPALKAAQIARKTLHYALGGPDEDAGLLAELQHRIQEVQEEVGAGRLGFLESMLVAQACALDAVFCQLATMGVGQKDRANLQVVMGLALRAQNGCRAAIETLATVKHPQGFTVVKQANMAGVQQVNNGTPPLSTLAHEKPGEILQSKLLEVVPHEPKRLDAGATGADAGLDSLVGAVAALHGTTHTGGQIPRVPQRVERRKARRAADRSAGVAGVRQGSPPIEGAGGSVDGQKKQSPRRGERRGRVIDSYAVCSARRVLPGGTLP